MRIAIIYDSASGNTKAIAMAIQRAMEGQDVVYVGPPQAEIQAVLCGLLDRQGDVHPSGTFLSQVSAKQPDCLFWHRWVWGFRVLLSDVVPAHCRRDRSQQPYFGQLLLSGENAHGGAEPLCQDVGGKSG